MRSPGGSPTEDSGAADDPDERPDATGEVVEEVPMHPALVPQGEAIAWSALGSLLGGPVVWGGVGILLDRIFGTGRVLLVVGLVVGTLTGAWIVYVRFGQDEAGKPDRTGS